jgi:hypothetical protein
VHNYNGEIILASNGMHIIRHGSQISNSNQNCLQPILPPTWFLSHYPPPSKAPTCFLSTNFASFSHLYGQEGFHLQNQLTQETLVLLPIALL